MEWRRFVTYLSNDPRILGLGSSLAFSDTVKAG